MLSENYNIYKKFDNTLLGFLLVIMSSIGIDVFMLSNCNLLINLVLCMPFIIASLCMLKAMSINSEFIQRCKDLAINQEEYLGAEKIKSKLNDHKILCKFKRYFWSSIILVFIGLLLYKTFVISIQKLCCLA